MVLVAAIWSVRISGTLLRPGGEIQHHNFHRFRYLINLVKEDSDYFNSAKIVTITASRIILIVHLVDITRYIISMALFDAKS